VRGKDGRYTVTLDGRALDVDYRETGSAFVSLLVDGSSHEVGISSQPGGYRVALDGHDLLVELTPAARGAAAAPAPAHVGPQRIASPMPGKIVRLLVEAGQEVTAEQGLLVIEAMKMENELRAARAGRVRETCVREGQAVEAGALLVVIE
jgi:biotin carboxyl carrier protein